MLRRLVILISGLAALGTYVPTASALDAGLRGQWHFDQVNGTGASSTTDDSSGLGQTGRFAATPTLAAGRFSSALDLTANSNTLYVDPPGGSWALEPQQVSVTVWFKRSGFPGTLKYLVAKGDVYPPNTCLGGSYGIYTGYDFGSHGGLAFYVHHAPNVSTASPFLPIAAPVWDGQWHVATGTYDGTTVRLYVDGVEVGNGTPATGSGIAYNTPSQATSQFTIGRYPQASCGDSVFHGGLDEVRVHDRALSVADIQTLHSASASTPPDLGPVSGPPPGNQPGPVLRDPTAEFRTVAPTGLAAKFGAQLLDASASTDASVFKWDLNGNGRVDLVTDPAEPFMLVRSSTTVAGNARLTTFNQLGTSSTISQAVKFSSPVGSGLSATQLKVPTVIATSSSRLQFSGALDPQAAVNKICLPTTVIFRLVEAKGCMTRTGKLDDVPAAELSVVRAHYGNEIFNKTVNAICNNVGKANGTGKVTTQADCDKAREYFKDRIGGNGLDAYVAKNTVRFNGLTITPRGGASVVIYPGQERIISSNATLTWGDFTIKSGQMDLNVGNATIRTVGSVPKDYLPEGQANLLYFNAADSVPEIAGFKLNGTVQLYLTGVNGVRSSVADLHVGLPAVFNVFGGNPPTGDVRLTADNASGGPVLDNLDLQVPETNLGAVYLRDVRFRYALRGRIDNDFDEGTGCSSKQWKAQAKIFITGTPQTGDTGFDLSPPPSQNGIGFCTGGFKHAGGRIVFGGPIPRPQVFPGVFLSHVGFAMQLNPTLLRGEAGLTVADFTQVDGALFMVFATTGQPYRLTAKDAGREFAQLEGSLMKSTTIAVGGAVKVPVPGYGTLELGDGALMYSYPDMVAFGGHVRVVVPGMSITGGVSGWAQARQRKFQLAASVDACLAGLKFGCGGASGMVGSKGMSACFNVLGLHPGGGYIWGDSWPTVWPVDGCKPSRFWEKASAAQAATTRTFTVAAGEDVKQLEIPGAGGAPKIKITAPDGETLTIGDTAETWVQSKRMVALRQDEGKVTWAGVKNGVKGSYKIEALPGSAAIQPISETRPGYSSVWKASVTGKGSQRVLTYDIGKPQKQSVTFVERIGEAAHVIGTATSGTGRIRFTPLPQGGAGNRTIQAVATIDGVPIPDQNVTTFTVAKSKPLGRTSKISVKRQGSEMLVRWNAVGGAKAYSVTLKSAGGASRTVRLGSKVHSRRYSAVPVSYAGTVSVTAQSADGRWGKARTVKFARREQPFTVIQTNSRNEKRELAKLRKKN